jgi:hypothetical protein
VAFELGLQFAGLLLGEKTMHDDTERALIEKIDSLEEKLAVAHEQVRVLKRSQVWTAHQDGWEPEGLPVPRLEMRVECRESDRGYVTERVSTQYLVYRHHLSHLVAVPLGSTSSKGSWPTREVAVRAWSGGIEVPHRDGFHLVHNAKHLKLPAFVISGDEAFEVVLDAHEKHPETGRDYYVGDGTVQAPAKRSAP